MADPQTVGGRGGGNAPPPAGFLRLDLSGIQRPIILAGADELLPSLDSILNGWTCSVTRPGADDLPAQPLATVLGRSDGYLLHSIHLDAPMPGLTATSAVCGLVADLAQSYFDQRPDWLALHCGGFRIRGRVVAATGPARAGKSTLMSRLSAEPDIAVICDDVLPLDPGNRAMALGCAPRLRLPLPPDASARFRDHLAACMTLFDDRYGYVRAPGLVPHGLQDTLSAVLVLDRREDAPAQFHRLDPAEAVHHLLRGNMATAPDVETTFERLHGIAANTLCLRLVYADLEDAVGLIRQAFATGDAWPQIDPAPALPAAGHRRAGPPVRLPRGPMQRQDGVSVRRVGGGDLFLCRPEVQDIVHLNPIGGAVWTMLASPVRAAEIAAALAEAFPDTDRARISADVGTILGEMHAAGLIRGTDT